MQKWIAFPLVDFAAMGALCEAQRHYDVAQPAEWLVLFYTEVGDSIKVHIYYPICSDCHNVMMRTMTHG